MIRCLIFIRNPGIDMDMIHLQSAAFLAECLTHVDVVELLAVLLV